MLIYIGIGIQIIIEIGCYIYLYFFCLKTLNLSGAGFLDTKRRYLNPKSFSIYLLFTKYLISFDYNI